MSDHKAELEARLRAAAEAAIAKALAERKAPIEATLADIERVARSAGQEIEQAVATALAQESAAELAAWPNCPQCGQKMKNKGQRRRRIVTEAGEMEVERTYYHCAACGVGIFPPGGALGVDRECLQPGASQADGLAGQHPLVCRSGRDV